MQVFCLTWGVEVLMLGEGTGRQCSVTPRQTRAVKGPPNLHTPLQTATLIKKKKKKLFSRNTSIAKTLFSFSFSKNLKCEFTNTENYSTNSNATQDMWILQHVWGSQHTCVGDCHVSAPTCIKILSPWFQDVRENQSASTRQLLPSLPLNRSSLVEGGHRHPATSLVFQYSLYRYCTIYLSIYRYTTSSTVYIG